MGDPAGNLGARLARRLSEARQPDGGFGWGPGAPSEAEPTALAALALEGDERAQRWLLEHRNAGGAFTFDPGGVAAVAVNPLVALALPDGDAREAAIDASLAARARLVSEEDSTEAWGWNLGTFSWVEPTARVLLMLRLHRPSEEQAISEAIGLLAEREVPGGGWNYGNASVLGTDLKPYIQTTAAAVMALQGGPADLLERGMGHLEGHAGDEPGGLSLAMAIAALALTSGEVPEELVRLLSDQYDRTGFLGNVGVLAWSVLATGPGLELLRVSS